MSKSIIEQIHTMICTSPRDFAQNPLDAFLYALVVGWDESNENDEDEPGARLRIQNELSKKFGWTEEDWKTIGQLHRSLKKKQQKTGKELKIMRDRILGPEATLEIIKNETSITIVWENGFNEDSQTTKVFVKLEGEEEGMRSCAKAFLGHYFTFSISPTAGSLSISLTEDLIRAGEYSYICLNTRMISRNRCAIIENDLLNQKKMQAIIEQNAKVTQEEVIAKADNLMPEVRALVQELKSKNKKYLSVTKLIRHFHVSYRIASTIIDNLIQLGIVSSKFDFNGHILV